MERKLKVAFYTDSFLPAHDGVVSSILALRKGLEARGHEVYIFAAGNEATERMARGDSHIIVAKGVKFSKYPQYNIALLPFASALRLNEIRPDIIHVHTPFTMGTFAVLAAKAGGIPVVGTFHTMFMDRNTIESYVSSIASGRIAGFAWRYARLFFNWCDAVIAPSDPIRRLAKRNGIRNVHTVPNGIDTSKFNASARGVAIRRRVLRGAGGKIVLYVGRMSREKRIEVLLKAAHILRREGITFVFVGTGPALEHYERMARTLGLGHRARFVGFVDDKLLPKYYAAADLFCIPSTFETQGMVAIEAMAEGKPVVGADSLALKEVIIDGMNGEKFRPGDAKSCARKIKKAINNLSSYKETTKTAQKYSIRRTTAGVLDVYSGVLRNARARKPGGAASGNKTLIQDKAI